MGVNGFTSTAFGSLDAKGRVCVPLTFRQVLEGQNTKGLYVYRSVLDQAVDCFGQDVYDFMQAQYADTNPLFDAVMNDDLEDFSAHTTQLQFDNNGRVRLPDDLIAYAGLTDKVAFVGMGRKFQICTPEQYKVLDDARTVRIRSRMQAQRAAALKRIAGEDAP